MCSSSENMKAAVLKRKKTTINKGKIKKTIKNVICRPDPIYWPIISDEERKELEIILNKYRVDIPDFIKPHWNDLKSIPKSERPKRPPIEKVEGLVFGLSQCRSLIEINQLAALILDSAIKPKAIVLPLLEVCNTSQVPVLCITGLRKISVDNFGIKTSCLGLKKEFLSDLANKIIQISKYHQPQNSHKISKQNNDLCKDINQHLSDVPMTSDEDCDKVSSITTSSASSCPYLYRTSKKRIFVPANIEKHDTISKQFMGQNFIELRNNTDKQNNKEKVSKAYKKMVVKRISNNPNRVKIR